MHPLLDLPPSSDVVSLASKNMNTSPSYAVSVYAIGLPYDMTEQVSEAATTVGIGLREYATPESLMDSASSAAVGCILLSSDWHATQVGAAINQLKLYFQTMPIVVLHHTDSHDDVVDLMQRGAFSVVSKLVSHDQLVETLATAVEVSVRSQTTVDEGRDSSLRMRQATWKELEVLTLIMEGRKNKEISAALGITVRAVEDRRFRLMKKVGVDSVAELVATAVRARYYEQGFTAGGGGLQQAGPRNCLKGIEIWKPDETDSQLHLHQSSYRDAAVFSDASRSMTFKRGEGLPGMIWESRAPAFLCELITTEFARAQIASAAGMTTAIGFPVFARGRVQSIVVLLMDTRYQSRAALESWKFDRVAAGLKLAGGTYVNCERLRRLTEFMTYPLGQGLPGRAAEQRRPCAAARFAEDPAAIRGVALSAERLTAGVAIPLTDSGSDVDDVFVVFNAESAPLFSVQQIWKTAGGGSRLVLTSEHIGGVSSLVTQMQNASAIPAKGIVDEAWKTAAPVVYDAAIDPALEIASSLPDTRLTTGIAIPTIVDGNVVAVTVLAD